MPEKEELLRKKNIPEGLSEETANELVVGYSNDLLQLSFASLTASEQNLLFFLIASVRDQGKKTMSFSYNEIRKAIGYRGKSNDNLHKQIREMNKKLLEKSFCFPGGGKDGSEEDGPMFTFFQLFNPVRGKRTLEVMVSDPFLYLVNALEGNFSLWKLPEFVDISGRYAKNIYPYIMQFKDTGVWCVSFEEFKEKAGFGNAYNDSSNLRKRVLNPAVEELKSRFEGLEYELIKDQHKQGRPIIAIKFTFKPQRHTKKDRELMKAMKSGSAEAGQLPRWDSSISAEEMSRLMGLEPVAFGPDEDGDFDTTGYTVVEADSTIISEDKAGKDPQQIEIDLSEW